MSQRYHDNINRQKPKENQLGILKIYAFCQKIQQRASGPGESAAWVTYLSIRIHIEKNMSFDGKTIKSSDTVELLGITLDKNIIFKQHIQNICHKANNKTKALLHIRRFLNLEHEQVLAEAYISSNFRYSPLICMFCGKMSDNLIVKIHYRTPRAIYDTQTQSYEELLHLSGKTKSIRKSPISDG